MLPPVVKSITVPCDPEKAFDLFTRDISNWWPKDKHSVSAMNGKVARVIGLDLSKGGEIWEIDHEGKRVLWGSFADFDRPDRVRINWHINSPADQATMVEVAFKPAKNGTEVVLSHSNWETLGDQAENMRNGYNNGWVHVFEECFKSACG